MTQTLAPTPVARPRSRRATGQGRIRWAAAVLVVAVLVVAPVAAVLVDTAATGLGGWPSGLGSMVVATLGLMTGVAAGTLLLGCGLAWLVTAYDFWLRDVMVWLLVLPLAVPAYILGFVFLSTFDAAGSMQSWLRAAGVDGLAVSVRGLGGCIVVMTLALYPYVYLMARAAFVEQAAQTREAAFVLGASNLRTFFTVVLPLARPSLAAGLALVMMEVLTDFATVQYFGVQTVSYGVYTTWRTTYDFGAAVQLATLVLFFALAVLAGERLLRGRAGYDQSRSRRGASATQRLHGGKGAAALLACVAALAAGFVVPVVQLVAWTGATLNRSGGSSIDPRYPSYIANSLVVATIAAVVCVGLAVVVAHAVRLGGGRGLRALAQLTTFGYAMPGAVVGIGTLLLLASLDRLLRWVGVPGGTGLLVTGSVVAILYAYAVRFLGPAYQAVDSSFAKLPAAITASALTLGARPMRVLVRVHLPLVRPGVMVALVLVAIDAIKELPVVLLLRPFGFTTVSVWVYQLASENLWKLAALPALLIVGLAIVPVAVLFRQVRVDDRTRRKG